LNSPVSCPPSTAAEGGSVGIFCCCFSVLVIAVV
jgi:hypothetical protein